MSFNAANHYVTDQYYKVSPRVIWTKMVNDFISIYSVIYFSELYQDREFFY